jgi:hypothetical protein
MVNELAVRNVDVSELRSVADLLVKSGFFDSKGSVEQQVAQLATKILAGRELGYGPYASVQGIHVIQGKPTVSGNLMAAAVKSSGKYDYRVRQMDDKACKIEFFQREGGKLESIGFSEFTAADAQKAGTQNMAKFARNMLFNRAISNGVRWYCPDVFGTAVYSPEELGASINGEGDYIETTVRVVDEHTGELEPVLATDSQVKLMHKKGREAFGEEWRNGIGRQFTQDVTGKESTQGISADEVQAIFAALEDADKVAEYMPAPTVHVEDAVPLPF